MDEAYLNIDIGLSRIVLPVIDDRRPFSGDAVTETQLITLASHTFQVSTF
jgi:hypothetical protein